MAFDACEYVVRTIVIKAAMLLREAKGLPEIKDSNVLFNSVALEFGLSPSVPSPPIAQICPTCGRRTYMILGICPDCKDSEGGKYKTALRCQACGYQQKSEEPVVVWLQRFGLDYGTQTKESLGVKTITDKGVM